MLSGFFLLIAGIILYRILPVAEELAVSKLQGQIILIENEEIIRLAEEKKLNFEEIYSKSKTANERGDIYTLDMTAVNLLKSELVKNLQQRLEDEINVISINVPSGGFISTGKGIRLNVKLIGIYALNAEIAENFHSEGYNHTLHSYSVKTEIDGAILLFGKLRRVKINTSVPLFDAVIIGDVPNLIIDKKY